MILDSLEKKWLERRFKNRVKFREPMSRHTSLKIGGPADAYVAPETLEDLQALVKWAWGSGIPYLVIGDGTNLLVKDGGISGIVIVLTKCLNKISKTDNKDNGVIVTAMAGVRLHKLCTFAVDNGLKGMNFALGIPGTIGGGIMMNAGTSRQWMERVLDSITILLPEGTTKILKIQQLDFSYRKLSWKNEYSSRDFRHPVIIDGCFWLHPWDVQKLKEEAKIILRSRRKSQPISSLSAGCFFKNPESDKSAGELIERAGMKGKKIGGAEISSKHANFIINTGNASATDILKLMDIAHQAVSKTFGIDLELEVKIVGK